MTDVKTYDPAEVRLFVAGFQITGFEPGQFIQLQPSQEAFSDDFGVDGEPIRWANRDPFSTLALTLRQTAPANGILSNLVNIDLLSQAGVVPVLLEHGDSLYVSARGWVQGHTPVEFEDRAAARRWTLRLLDTIYNTQGVGTTPALIDTIT